MENSDAKSSKDHNMIVKKCRFCAENILIDALLCKHCGKNQQDLIILRILKRLMTRPVKISLFFTGIGVIILIFITMSRNSKDEIEIECTNIWQDRYKVAVAAASGDAAAMMMILSKVHDTSAKKLGCQNWKNLPDIRQ